MTSAPSKSPAAGGNRLSRRRFAYLAVGAAAAASVEAARTPPAAAVRIPAVNNRVYTITDREPSRPTLNPKQEFRAFWLATVVNIDWPSRAGLTAAVQQSELRSWLDLARSQNHNAVLLQVRPSADTFWPSSREPWSRYLTGAQGRSPGYDPLAFAIREAHARNLQLHVWFNPYRVNMDSSLTTLTASHPARRNPGWSFPYGGRRYYNPGIPAVRRFVQDVIMEVVTRYDIDGVHFDDYFYPYPVAGQTIPDAATYAAYRGGFTSIAAWRRNNINSMIREISSRIFLAKPWMVFGIGPFGIWRNRSSSTLGSATSGLQSYDAQYADSRNWVRQGWIDYVAPQIYWHQGFSAADYNVLVNWWSNAVSGTNVKLYIGEAAYRVGDPVHGPDWQDPLELRNHVAKCRATARVRGNIYFSARSVRANRLAGISRVRSEFYRTPALTPAMSHLGAAPLPAPRIRTAGRFGTATRLTWLKGATGAAPVAYAIYRFSTLSELTPLIPSTAERLRIVHRARGGTEVFVDPTAVRGQRYWYVVTALSRTWVESTSASAIRIVA